jgi:hypothetical protein
MPDIAMYNGGKCPQKDKCRRFTAKPDKYWQSYFSKVPYEKYGHCDHYWPDRRFVKEAQECK